MSATTARQVKFVVVFLIVVLMFVSTFRLGVVHGQSMLPTYTNGQVVLVRRPSWVHRPLQHDDVVLVRKDRDVLIKRVMALPGETLTDPDIIRRTLANQVDVYYERPPGDTDDNPHLIVPDGQIVVIGDNRRVSDDSRAFGPVPIRDVLGTVVAAPPPPTTSAAPMTSIDYRSRFFDRRSNGRIVSPPELNVNGLNGRASK